MQTRSNLAIIVSMKTAVITGVSYGIGKSITEQLLNEDWKIYGLSRSKPDLTNKNFIWLECDLSKPEGIASCLSSIVEPTIDALISNAGVIEVEKASDVSKASYERTFSVNVLAPMLIVHALKDKITQSTIISVSSVSDRIPEADVALYCSSKAANTLYFNALADELRGAKIVTLLPDYVDTPMLRTSMADNEGFDWSATIQPEAIATVCSDIISGKQAIESGSNIIIVTEKLKEDLKSVEKLYGFNTSTDKLVKLMRDVA